MGSELTEIMLGVTAGSFSPLFLIAAVGKIARTKAVQTLMRRHHA